MINVFLSNGEILQYDADQATIEPDGKLSIYRWLAVGPYKCPLKKDLVAELPAGQYIRFNKD